MVHVRHLIGSHRWVGPLLAAAALGLGAAACGSEPAVEALQGGSVHEPVEVAETIQAPTIEGVDPITGATHRLADFAGKPVVVNFWASWCAPCRQELPDLQRFADANPGVAVLGVDLDDTTADARALQQELGFSFPSVALRAAQVAATFDLLGMPTTFFLDEQHRIRARVAGVTDAAGFARGIEIATGRDGP